MAGVLIFADTAGSDDISVTTLEGSLQYLQNLPSCGEGQMVPVAVKLFPLSAFGSQASQASINDTTIRLAFQTLEDLHTSAKEVGDLLVKHPTGFHAWEQDVATLQTQFEHYSDDIQTRIARTVTQVQSRDASSDEPSIIAEEHLSSEYSPTRVRERFQRLVAQVEHFDALVKVLEQAGVKITASFADLLPGPVRQVHCRAVCACFGWHRSIIPAARYGLRNAFRKFRPEQS